MPTADRRTKRQRLRNDPVARYLGELQAEVMALFWKLGSATVREIVDELNQRRSLAYTTVLTLVSRLWARGLLTREREGRGYRYRAAQTRDEFLGRLSDESIDRLLGDFGDIAVARLGERLDELDATRQGRLARERRDKP